ncbi:5'-3' exonuclease [Noviherbaspirillum galbum]|uniref:5'-3' exonuclease n=1 Tax=Noviherbaspirillum galbum TaxID=2709383 RepID=A0A6B3SFW3_9BURK|nr:5'-3' exonuclease H3TH domain-containing protein [Noviherbaspirillum galbum]NEX59548.1 5'-3' exonuclease [Noviherbaspirillum galbum]
MKTLLAIDALQILRRAYETLPEGEPAQRAADGMRSALATVRGLVELHAPSHLLVTVDAGGQSWRHLRHPPYRSSRKPMPEALAEGLPDYLAELAAFGVEAFHKPGHESVDVIATACLRWLEEGRGVAIACSASRELLALLPRGLQVWDAARREWHDAGWVERKYGVPPALLTDYFACCGDPDDDIPGIDRVGGKTAAKLLNAHGSLEAVFAGPGTLLDATGRHLRAGHADALLSRELVTPKTDLRLGLTWRSLQLPASSS